MAKKFGGCFLPFFQDIILLFFLALFSEYMCEGMNGAINFAANGPLFLKIYFSYIIGISISVSYFHAIYLEAGENRDKNRYYVI